MSGKTLVLVTRPLGSDPGDFQAMALKMASQIVLIQDGVFNSPAMAAGSSAYGAPGGHRAALDTGAEVGVWPSHCAALEEDVKARRRRTGIRLIGYAELVELIASHDKILTI